MILLLKFFCPKCGKICEEARRPVRCSCGSPLKSSQDWTSFEIQPSATGMWRYGRLLPPVDHSISMGEGWTPLVASGSKNLYYKLEYISPTGSFKDRGAVIVMGEAKSLGCRSVVQDSSGNAGASIAAYAARCGIHATIVVPKDTPDTKKRQIEIFGAELIVAEGGRDSASFLAMEMARTTYYASHVWNPLFTEGTRTIAFEIWEQLGEKAPDIVIVPAGNGTILLGVFKGFKELLQRVRIKRMPRIYAVQNSLCAPLFSAFRGSPAEECRSNTADGISIGDPPRLKEMLDAVRVSRGEIMTVQDKQILDEQRRLALEEGFLVEPTAAAASAAERILRDSGIISGRDVVVVPLTGSGLKKLPRSGRTARGTIEKNSPPLIDMD